MQASTPYISCRIIFNKIKLPYSASLIPCNNNTVRKYIDVMVKVVIEMRVNPYNVSISILIT